MELVFSLIRIFTRDCGKISVVQKTLELNGNRAALNLKGCILSVKYNPILSFQRKGSSFNCRVYLIRCYYIIFSLIVIFCEFTKNVAVFLYQQQTELYFVGFCGQQHITSA